VVDEEVENINSDERSRSGKLQDIRRNECDRKRKERKKKKKKKQEAINAGREGTTDWWPRPRLTRWCWKED
jgi:hypothetical protein